MIGRGVDRRKALGGGFAALAVAGDARAARSADVPLELTGTPIQSGLMIGRTVPLAQIRLDDIDLTADSEGRFVIGFDRDAPSQALLTVTTPEGGRVQRTLFVAHRSYRRSVIRGLPQGTIEPPPEVRARIERESAVKKVAAASIAPGAGFAEPFDWPVPSRRITSPWGAQRVLNGTAQRPHYGVDIGVPAGTPIRAPAPGIVILAEDDYWFEGGVVAIDHGQGLHTMYIHQNKVGATAGQVVARGDVIGEVGAKGRATGPHLCWRMRWRGRQCDPTLRVVAA